MTLSIQDAIQEEIVTITAPQFEALSDQIRELREFLEGKEGNLMNVKQTAEKLNVCEATVRNLVHNQKLKCSRSGNRMMFSAKQIKDYQNG